MIGIIALSIRPTGMHLMKATTLMYKNWWHHYIILHMVNIIILITKTEKDVIFRQNFEETLGENIEILKDIAVYVSERNIHLIITVFPATIYYQTFFDMNFREYFYDALEQVNEEVHLVDCFGDPFFDEEDFNDTDHLNDSGAAKMTLMLNHLLQQMNECDSI